MPISNPLIKLQIDQSIYQNLGGKQIAEFVSPNLATNQTHPFTLPLGKTFLLFNVATSHPARIRLYTSSAYRENDLNRSLGIDPSGEVGLILEAVLSQSNLNLDLAPLVWGANLESNSKDIAISLTSLALNSNPQITVKLLFIEAEI